jgi:hypothetical protein
MSYGRGQDGFCHRVVGELPLDSDPRILVAAEPLRQDVPSSVPLERLDEQVLFGSAVEDVLELEPRGCPRVPECVRGVSWSAVAPEGQPFGRCAQMRRKRVVGRRVDSSFDRRPPSGSPSRPQTSVGCDHLLLSPVFFRESLAIGQLADELLEPLVLALELHASRLRSQDLRLGHGGM